MKSSGWRGAIFAFFIFIGMDGCTYNVNEETQEVSLTHTSAGLTKIVMKTTLLDDNTISVQGVDERSIAISAVARMLVIKDEDVNLSGLQLTISPDGIIGYTGAEKYQDRVTLDDLTMALDKYLDCDFESVSGDIKIEGMEGFLTCGSTSGNCIGESSQGCSIKTISGDISVTVVSDSLIDSTQWSMKSVSGDIELFLPADTGAFTNKVCTITITATSGDVTVTVPEGFRADVSYKSTSGDLSTVSGFIDIDTSIVKITCKTISGDLRIRSYNQ